MAYVARPRLIIALFALLALACGSVPFAAAPTAVPEQRETAAQAPQATEEPPEPTVGSQSVLAQGEGGDGMTTAPTPAGELPSALAPNMGNVALQGDRLVGLYEQVTPGVVSINIQTQAGGGSGSGFIVDAEQGYIVTNDHVVEGAQDVIVTFFNNLQARAEVIGTDDDSDLAVIQVDTLPEGVHALTLGNSNAVRPGQDAIAIGNPFGQQGTMTYGIISAVGRTISSLEAGFSIPLAIQTDAPINPGNSGGPLLNVAGAVIGVNSQIYSPSGSSAGLGYAVPSNIVSRVVPGLIEEGAYRWAWLGVSGLSVNLTLVELLDLPVQQGAYVVDVVPEGPAAAAGLRGAELTNIEGLEVPVGGDIIVEADGEPILSWEALLGHIAFTSPGDVTVLTVMRDGAVTTVEVTLGERPSDLQGEETGIP